MAWGLLPALLLLSSGVAVAQTPALTEFRVQVSRFVVRGMNLASVEIWFSPTGADAKPGRLGVAKRSGGGKKETWLLDIPPDVLATEVYAVGYDANHKEVARKYLSARGASAIFRALYGDAPQ